LFVGVSEVRQGREKVGRREEKLTSAERYVIHRIKHVAEYASDVDADFVGDCEDQDETNHDAH
jgi:hypothetical protein